MMDLNYIKRIELHCVVKGTSDARTCMSGFDVNSRFIGKIFDKFGVHERGLEKFAGILSKEFEHVVRMAINNFEAGKSINGDLELVNCYCYVTNIFDRRNTRGYTCCKEHIKAITRALFDYKGGQEKEPEAIAFTFERFITLALEEATMGYV